MLGFKEKGGYAAKIPLIHKNFPVFTLGMNSISISPRSNVSGERSNFLTVDRTSTTPAMITASTYSLNNLAEGTVSEEGVEITKLLEEHERLEKLRTPDSGALIQKETTETGRVYYQNILIEFLTTVLNITFNFFCFTFCSLQYLSRLAHWDSVEFIYLSKSTVNTIRIIYIVRSQNFPKN